jgi:DNA-binding response OmpR family regulator
MSNLSKILVVEDSPLLLLDLCDQLEEMGYTPVSATTAATAARLVDDTITAMITDIELGLGPDGLALARLAAQARPGLPIVVVSGGVIPTATDLPSGAIFVPKPYSLDAVLAALHSQKMATAA